MSREAKLLSREFQNKHPRLREHWACFRGSSKPGGVRLCRAAVMHNSLRGQLLISIKPSPTTTPFFHTDLEDYRKEGNENLNFFHYLDTIMALLVCFVLPPTASILIRCKIYLYVTRSRENIGAECHPILENIDLEKTQSVFFEDLLQVVWIFCTRFIGWCLLSWFKSLFFPIARNISDWKKKLNVSIKLSFLNGNVPYRKGISTFVVRYKYEKDKYI